MKERLFIAFSILFLMGGLFLRYRQSHPLVLSAEDKQPFSEEKGTTKRSYLLEYAVSAKFIGIKEEEAKPYLTTLDNFYTYSGDQKARGVLSMFSPPADEKEKKELEFIDGTDLLIGPDAYRLYVTRYFNYLLMFYQVYTVEKLTDGRIKINTLESRVHPVFDEEAPDEGQDRVSVKARRFIIVMNKFFRNLCINHLRTDHHISSS